MQLRHGLMAAAVGRAMQQVAQLIKADLGLEIAFVDLGGWDTHVNQGAGNNGLLAQRLDEFGKSLAAFSQDLGDRMADVCVITMSEFGGGVRGGRVAGTWPGLATDQRAARPGRDDRLPRPVRRGGDEAARHRRPRIGVSGTTPRPRGSPG